jgi:hypothetical protein
MESPTMGHGLYLGKQVDPESGALGARVDLDPSDLLTHGLIVGMTGSGKTGLGVALIEEVLRQGIPVLAIDPKGDLGNLLLLFERLDAASLAPWVDAAGARRDGKSVDAAAAEAAAAWAQGLADWGLSTADVAALRAGHDALILTPGSRAGVPLNVLQSLEAPSTAFASAEEDLRDEIGAIVSGILGLLKIEADPLQSREAILLANLIEAEWRAARGLTLERLVTGVAEPPFERLGALPLESVYPRQERESLMIALNNLLASPSFALWRQGEPLDIEALLSAPDGRPRLSIVYTAHLDDAERSFVTALVLEKLKTWTRRQAGTPQLRALLYMDEIVGYFPPHPSDPPTKRPLLALLKQARAHGVGVLLATQNPVDLDYKGLSNMGVWMVGKLQTDQDRDRLRDGLVGSGGADAATVDRLLSATRKRVFLLHDIHRPEPCLLHSRWALSYLRGPLTREEVTKLMANRPEAARDAAPPEAGAAPPPLPAPLRHRYLDRSAGTRGEPHLLVKYAVRYKGLEETVAMRAWPLLGRSAAEALEAAPLDVDEAALQAGPPAGLTYAALPPFLASAGAKGVERALRERLPDKLALTLLTDPVTRSSSRPGETRDTFAARLRGAGAGAKAERLRESIEKKKGDLASREQELSGRKTEKWAAIGTALLANLGLLRGRKRTITGAGTVLSKNRMENTAQARVEALQGEIARLEEELQAVLAVDPSRFEEKTLVPSDAGVEILGCDVVWVY